MNIFSFRRNSLSTPAFVALALLLAPACQLDIKAGGNPEDSSGGADSSTGSGATTIDGSSSGATTTDGSSSGEATTGELPNQSCEAPDPAAQAAVMVDLGEWPSDFGASEEKRVSAGDCTVQSATSEGGTIDIALLCSEGELVDMPVGLQLTGPADFAVDLVPGDAVKLAAFWRDVGVDIVDGRWFTLHDMNGGLLLAGYDLKPAVSDDPPEALAPLSITVVDGVCEPTCEINCRDPEPGLVERLALRFTHESGPSIELLDESRGPLLAGGEHYDIVVARADTWSVVNGGPTFRWIVRQADQE